MNCIVTAGPTFEPLDDVRRLTNFSTGRLGTELANFLTARGHRVILLVGAGATFSGRRDAQRVEIFSTTADLRNKLKALAASTAESAAAVFHAAAVSDFAFGKVFEPDAAGRLSEVKPAGKFPTRRRRRLVELVPTPKILSRLRVWFPGAKIVGWKFEVEGARTDALGAAREQLVKCSTDLCVVNGPAYGPGFGLLGRKGNPAHLPGALALFDALEKFVRA